MRYTKKTSNESPNIYTSSQIPIKTRDMCISNKYRHKVTNKNKHFYTFSFILFQFYYWQHKLWMNFFVKYLNTKIPLVVLTLSRPARINSKIFRIFCLSFQKFSWYLCYRKYHFLSSSAHFTVWQYKCATCCKCVYLVNCTFFVFCAGIIYKICWLTSSHKRTHLLYRK